MWSPVTTTVTALIVSHDGDRWLSVVLDGLARQTRRADRVVAVDTGSTDAGPRLLRERLGGDAVLTASPGIGYGEAVEVGLAAGAAAGGDEWVWLLHDDGAPAPDALEQLLAVAASRPSASVLGPKLREWPSLRRLLEVGVTISGTGRRETGLEPGEYDQGQHDEIRHVLAVNTAGMLVRRPVLESLGFDPQLPVFGNDIDFGWRAARAGEQVLVVPGAVVFHVEAAHRGVRVTQLTGSRRRGERAAALYILLVNAPAATLPLRIVRLLLGSLLRVFALVLLRSPGAAVDELLALATTYLRPRRMLSGRRSPRRTATVPHRDVRHLLAPAWLPYRHGLELVGDLLTALPHRDEEPAGAHRVGGVEASETGPVAPEMQTLPDSTGSLARLVSSPVAWVFTGLTVAAVVSARGLVGPGTLAGGALLPAPESAFDWWRTYFSSWHQIGTGSSAPAAPYVAPLAVIGTALLGQASLAVDLLFLPAVPLAAWGGYRFLARATSSRTVSLWGAAAYGVLPVVTGAVQQGRIGTVVGTLVLPWLAHAALFLRPGETADRRARAAWRTALWLAVLTAFVPVAWAMAAAVGVVAVAVAGSNRDRTALTGSVLPPLVVTLLLLLPWSWAIWGHHGAASVLLEAGLPAPRLTGVLTRWDVLAGRPGPGAPGWMSLGVLLAAAAALARRDTRRPVLRAWLVLVVALGTTALLATGEPGWLGFPLVVAQGAAITAAALAGPGIRDRLTGASFGWRQPLGVLVVALAVLTPVVSAVWWVASGSAGPLQRGRASAIPEYMTDAALHDPTQGVLVIRGSPGQGFRYLLLRQPGLRLGDDAVLPSRADQSRLTSYVAGLVSSPAPSDLTGLSRTGVGYVYAPAPADPSLVESLDSASGVAPGSASGRGDRAWQLEATPTGADLRETADAARPWLLAAQGAALIGAVVLAAPTRRPHR